MTDEIADRLARVVKAYLDKTGITGRELNNRAGMYRGRVYDILTGRVRTLDVVDFFMLAWAMDRDPIDLAHEIGISHP